MRFLIFAIGSLALFLDNGVQALHWPHRHHHHSREGNNQPLPGYNFQEADDASNNFEQDGEGNLDRSNNFQEDDSQNNFQEGEEDHNFQDDDESHNFQDGDEAHNFGLFHHHHHHHRHNEPAHKHHNQYRGHGYSS